MPIRLISLFKIATVISYCCIQIDSEHVGGPAGLYIVLGLLSTKVIDKLLSLLILMVLLGMIYSTFKSKQSRDVYLFMIGGLILIIPLIQHMSYTVEYKRFVNWIPFAITSLLFLGIEVFTSILIFRKRI